MKLRKLFGGLAIAAVATVGLASCGDSTNGEQGKVISEGGKVGIILGGTEGGETKAFKDHWEALAKELDVEVVYQNFKGQDPAYYTECAEKLVAQGADAVICNFEMDGKENVLEYCADNEVYVSYSGSTLADEYFEEYAENPYFVGQIAPSKETEQRQAYDMTKYYIDLYYGANKQALPAGTSDIFAVWPVDYHGLTLAHQMTYRWKGIKQALEEAGVTVSGDTDSDCTKWTVSYSENSVLKDKVKFMSNNLADMNALITQCVGVLMTNPCTVVTTCNGNYLLNMFASKGAFTKASRFSTIDSFVTDYEKWYKADTTNEVKAYQVQHDPYLVGKFSAINEAVLATTVKAMRGNAIRDNGKAININQNYWYSTNLQEFTDALNVSKDFSYTVAEFNAITTPAQLQKLFDDATLANLKAKLNK